MYMYSGKTDIGYNRTYNEDYLYIKNLDKTEKNEDYLAMVLDGNGTNMGRNDNADMKVIPSTLLGHEISSILSEIYENNREMLYSYPVDCLKMAVRFSAVLRWEVKRIMADSLPLSQCISFTMIQFITYTLAIQDCIC